MERSLSDAIALAAVAHAGQHDKGGEAYVTHPLRVMQQCKPHGLAVQMAAVLHDTVEDTWVTLELLRTMGYPEEVVAAIDALTRRKGQETYEEYIVRCSRNRIAALVKLADLEDNSDPTRPFGPHTEAKRARYAEARDVLSASLA